MNDILHNITGFDWDVGNADKNWVTHGVTRKECEEVFFNLPLLLKAATKHREKEKRICALGRTDASKPLFIVFTLREKAIRIVSARPMSRKERDEYGQEA